MNPEVTAALTQPVVAVAAAVAVLLVIVAAGSVEALDTVIHEGAHMVVGFLTGREVCASRSIPTAARRHTSACRVGDRAGS
jgi:hypothetical protein